MQWKELYLGYNSAEWINAFGTVRIVARFERAPILKVVGEPDVELPNYGEDLGEILDTNRAFLTERGLSLDQDVPVLPSCIWCEHMDIDGSCDCACGAVPIPECCSVEEALHVW